jgi:hypothetical protein
MQYEKVYVGVIVKFDIDGGFKPLEILWVDGQKFKIDRVKYIERAPSKTGGILTQRYTIMVEGLEKQLYYESRLERWFVERKIK